MQQKTAIIRPATSAATKHLEKLAIGGVGERYKR